ncbi:MAG: TRAP transporter large permease [Anaerotignum sp.]|jgi:C4-dicarboxylate transporter DctM subunit|nr:TRAP transporter large permease [Anaerotignum sp.]
MTLILFGTFFLFVFLNIPIAVSLGITAMIGLYVGGFQFSMFPNVMYASIGKFALLAIPFFVLAGSIMEYAGISQRLVTFARTCVGHRKSGMISVTVIVCCFFAAISGSGPATVAALGTILIPAMVHQGYDRGMSTALLSASGAIGIIIPPSIAFVVYASCTGVSVGALFSAGIIPGILVGASYIIAALIASRGTEVEMLPKASAKERFIAFKDAFWALLMPVIILGGIYGGVFTPTEAAGVAVIYGLFVGIFIYKEIHMKELYKVFVDAAVSSATIMFIIATAAVYAWIMTTSGVAANLSAAILSISQNKILILIIINIIFLIAGCFLDANSAFYILLPIITPVLGNLGVDLIHAGVFLTVNMAIGLVTPPVGINLYVGCKSGGITVAEICRKIIPFLIAGIISLLLITYVEPISMFLPRMFGQV